ncbi:MAG TPA: CehA/McbA family metallohydrolase [Lacunisphaera sp.]
MISLSRGFAIAALAGSLAFPVRAATSVIGGADVDVQPLLVNARQISDALAYLGAPLSEAGQRRLAAAAQLASDDEAAREIQAVLDPHCLALLEVNPEGRVKVAEGPAARTLVQEAWRPVLVKVRNEAGSTAVLNVASQEAGPVYDKEYCGPQQSLTPVFAPAVPVAPAAVAARIRDRWLNLEVYRRPPMSARLGGARLEYAILCLQSRDAGRRAATFSFDLGQGTQDLGFRSELTLVFAVVPATPVRLRVRDDRGAPGMGAFVIRDAANRLYPSPFKRIAPDFFFQPQVYRADNETVLLAPGEYTMEFTRGPESLKETRRVSVGSEPLTLEFQARRWIDPAAFGYVSGDHHIHAAGCAHYTDPTQGVAPADMLRQIQGEDLKVGAVLTWGPCFDYQKQFFTRGPHQGDAPPHLLRYDIEVSGFGSHRAGHLCLLRLKEDNFPGGDSIAHWPTLGLEILRWAKRQGAVCGSPHSGFGLQVQGGPREGTPAVFAGEIPFLQVPVFSGIGAIEYLVDLTHELPGPEGKPVPAIDFLSGGNSNEAAVLTMWYHSLNCGFRPRLAGESDFPCITDERVGQGRTYVRCAGPLNYEDWCAGLAEGRGYVSDGLGHLIDFRVDGQLMGEGASELRLEHPRRVKVVVNTAALLETSPPHERLAWLPDKRSDTRLHPPPVALTPTRQPVYSADAVQLPWHLERARVAHTRRVPVEVVVNGAVVARREIEADGELRQLEFDVLIARSSWVAVRIPASAHTNPIFVLVGEKPVRASRRSAQWCLAGVDQCWLRNERFYAEPEKAAARAAYEHARQAYARIAAESDVD